MNGAIKTMGDRSQFSLGISLRSYCYAFLVGLPMLLIVPFNALAQTPDAAPTEPADTPENVTPPAIPENALEPQPDPLLPTMTVDRPLNPQEKDVLRAALTELQSQATAQLQAGNIPGAFEIFNRELRLRRYLSIPEEVTALARVGEVAWRQSQIIELRLITERLQQIEQQVEANPASNPNLPVRIAQAYETVRAKDQAVVLYTKLLTQAQQQQDVNRQIQVLSALGNLHLSWFEYPRAAVAYEQLNQVAEAKGDRTTQETALQQLARIYTDNNQPTEAIAAQQKLVDLYRSQRNLQPVPGLKLAIGDSYAALGQTEAAIANYQEAFAIARSVQQLAYGSDALQRLANLYRSQNRVDEALAVYRLLLDVEQQSYNTLGMMNTYDQMGQLLKERGNPSQALIAFQQGLQLAQQLRYKVDYFNTQIQSLNSAGQSLPSP
ncbi:tetratricopeptide repeat protein [Leptolyngbya ohadii]|uniref:tetratricopeptide repeat protein n=1 Tax=Leptolyngbya ohadii TaxID=1962290 RepID=UPI000B5A2133|nr:tetratricopeptide repeat protein [Leptolyngbya ohadii]